ncbi:hypothetical protein KGA66_09180 [Actinocrinis puniceicyclus]|uniref:Uncharacterized protein n=1 Tax=Actinocrinis puniceicyclus TaxID=977794 RepID=A0A8J8BAQ7_9ACTN|nr:hypothetical protein [Actinocrinis puniceicyclus]MBS2963217.1 hypothetical protein [Actinocrinis puniceicyclus]
MAKGHRAGAAAASAVRRRAGRTKPESAEPRNQSDPTEPTTAASARPSRRAVLTGGVGAGVLVALPDVLVAAPARAAASTPGSAAATTAPPAHFFLYGSTGPSSPPAVQGWRPPAARNAPAPAPRTVGTGLAARPARSADGASVAFPTVLTGPGGADVTLSVVDAASGAVQTEATVHLPGVPADASVLVRPVFAGAVTVALVIAVSVPSGWHTFRKSAAAGTAVVTPSANWTTHHVLAYLDRRTGTFTGPFDLADAPSLAWTDSVADAENLYLWTIREPAVSVGTKAEPLPAPPVRLLTFPLGSARPGRSVRSAGTWPGGATGLVLSTGDVVRVVDGRDLEVYTPGSDARSRRVRFAELQMDTAKAGATNLHARPDGTLVITNAAFGRALVVDPAAGFRTVAALEFPRPRISLGGPDAKSALSPDGSVLYTLGSADAGGLSAYDLSTGALVAAYGDGSHYSGVYRLPSGTVLGVAGAETGSRLGFLTADLSLLGTVGTDMYVAEVF